MTSSHESRLKWQISFRSTLTRLTICAAAELYFSKSLEGVYYFISYTANILDVILLIKSDFFEAIRLISKVSYQFMAYISFSKVKNESWRLKL